MKESMVMAPSRVYERFWANKWILDGCASLTEMAHGLREAADELEDMAKSGRVAMQGDVDNGMVMLTTTDPVVAEDFGFDRSEDDDDYYESQGELYGN